MLDFGLMWVRFFLYFVVHLFVAGVADVAGVAGVADVAGVVAVGVVLLAVCC